MEELTALSQESGLWENAERAKKLMSEKASLEDKINNFEHLNGSLNDLKELAELSEADSDTNLEQDVLHQLENLKEDAKHQELEALLNGEVDGNDTYLEVHAGSGGTEAQDWAEMLLRMYTRWAEKHHYKVEYIEETEGDVAGLKSATIKIMGHNAYGWLKSESGVHRLVRISPFDAAGRRHTSFASIGVYPVVDDEIEININEADCRIDTYRSSGAGGQHINKTDSAVRITHIPTGIVVSCQTQRSQFQNKETAWKMLKSRLYEIELQKREAKEQEIKRIYPEEKEEIVKACELCVEAKVDFVKTSTGFSLWGAKVEDVKLMRETVGPEMGVKAAGGVRTHEEMLEMVKNGATRIGTSSGAKLMK